MRSASAKGPTSVFLSNCFGYDGTERTNYRMKPEYDLAKLKGGVRGKYLSQATAGTNLVLIDSDLAGLFPDSDSVNRALRLLADTARAAATPKGRPQARLSAIRSPLWL